MNRLIIKNIIAFKNNHTFKNFIMINSIIFIFLAMILFVMCYCENNINEALDAESSKTIYINDSKKYSAIEKILEKNNKLINEIYYDIYVENYKIDNQIFNIITTDYLFNENTNSLKINSKWQDNIKISIVNLNDIVYDKEIEEDYIYINQHLAKELIKNKEMDALIKVVLNKQLNVKKVLNQLLEKDIDASVGEMNFHIETYQNFYDVLQILFMIFIICNIIIIFFITFSNVRTQNQNIYIMKACGYNYLKIINIYNLTLFIVLNIVFIAITIFLFILIIIVGLILSKNFLYLLNIIWFPFIIIITLTMILNSCSILLNNKFRIK